MEVLVCRAGIATPAKRIYSEEILKALVRVKRDDVVSRRMMGELDPDPNDMIIHFAKVSHLVTDLWFENDSLMADIEVLPTPSGKVLQQLLDAGCKVYFRMVGLGGGKVDDHGYLQVDNNYMLSQIGAFAESCNEILAFSGNKRRYRSIDDPWIEPFKTLFGR